MDEFVIPDAPGNRIVSAIIIAPFIIAGLATAVYGIARDREHSGGGYVLVTLGLVTVAIFGTVFALALRARRSPGLRLTADGFTLHSHSFSWADVDDFHFVSGAEGAGDVLRVVYTGAAEQRYPAIRRSDRWAKLGQHTAPRYISLAAFDTGGPPLQEILRRWKAGDRTAGRPAASIPERTPPEPEATFPIKRSERLIPPIAATALLVGSMAAGPALLFSTDKPELWALIGGGAIWLLVTAFFAAGLGFAVRELRTPGLILHRNGFEFGKHAWRWADIEEFRRATAASDGNAPFGVRVIYRPGIPLPSAPADLPLSMSAIDTQGRLLEDILRDGLWRFRAREQDDPGAGC